MEKEKVEVQDIVKKYGKGYKENHKIMPYVAKAMGVIEKWIYNRKFDLLNIKYFHVVMTIPSELYLIAKQNEVKVYNILFKATSETLDELAKDNKYLGAQIGFMEVLHTWGQTLVYHPHIHAIVPAGGIDKIGKWRNSKKKFLYQ